MSVETALVAILNGDATTTALIADRLFPRLKPADAALPCVVYHRLSTVPDIDLESPGMGQVRYRFTAWAQRSTEVTDISAALHNALDYTRSLPDIDRILPDNETDRHEDDALLHGRDHDFLVFSP